MQSIGILVLTATLLAAGVPSQAAPLGPFSKMLVFGDSLSDPGNVYALTANTPDPTPDPTYYPEHQFTSGNTWATQLRADFASGTNFAFGGAKAVTTLGGSPDFAEQRALYAFSSPDLGLNPVTAVFLGGNDLRMVTTPAEAAAVIASATTAIVTNISELIDGGLSDFLIFGLPNLGRLPAVVGTPQAILATEATVAFNAVLQGALAPLEARADLYYFDTFAVMETIFADPGAYGFTNTMDACLDSYPVCNAANAGSHIFYDQVHPTEAVHSIYADAVSAQLAAIPLPPSLLLSAAGLLVFAGIGRRNRRSE